MKKIVLSTFFFIGCILNIKAQDYLVLMGGDKYENDYRILFLRQEVSEKINDTEKNVIKLVDNNYQYFLLKIINNGYELFPCCENDTTSYSGMDQYEKNLQKYGDSIVENLKNKYQKMIDSTEKNLQHKGSLKVSIDDTVFRIYSVKLAVCDCVYESVRNSNRIYFNNKYLKKIMEFRKISSREKQMLKQEIRVIKNLFKAG